MEKYKSGIDENSIKGMGYFKLTGKLGAAIGAGASYFTGFAVGALKEAVIDNLPYLLSGENLQNILSKSVSTGTKYATEFAAVGTILGLIFAKLYARKSDDEYIEEE